MFVMKQAEMHREVEGKEKNLRKEDFNGVGDKGTDSFN